MSTKKINIPCVFKYQFDGLYYEENSKEPFSGCQFIFTEDMIPIDEVNYKEGKLHGIHKSYSKPYSSGGLLLTGLDINDDIFGDTFHDNA